MEPQAPGHFPLFALSMEDYEEKMRLVVDELPHKIARTYLEPLKYQALVGTIIGIFEKYPLADAIQFGNGGGRKDLSSYRLIPGGPNVKKFLPYGYWNEPGCEHSLTDANKLLGNFFASSCFRETLGNKTFHRGAAPEQLRELLVDRFHQTNWDLPWEAFIGAVHAHLGKKPVSDRAQDPKVEAIFQSMRAGKGFEAAVNSMGKDGYLMRPLFPGKDGKPVKWSPLARLAMLALNTEKGLAEESLQKTLGFDSFDIPGNPWSKPEDGKWSGRAKRFYTLAGRHENPSNRAPEWADELALLRILANQRIKWGKMSMCPDDIQKGILEWAGVNEAEADRRTLSFCASLRDWGIESTISGPVFCKKIEETLDSILYIWLSEDPPKDLAPNEKSFELMARALLTFGGLKGDYWRHPLDIVPIPCKVKFGLACLGGKDGQSQNRNYWQDETNQALEEALNQGARISANDPDYKRLMQVEGLDPSIRARIIATQEATDLDKQTIPASSVGPSRSRI